MHSKPAADSLKTAIANGQTDPVVYSYLAQAHYGLKRYDGVVFAFEKAGEAGRSAPGLFLMLALSHTEVQAIITRCGDGRADLRSAERAQSWKAHSH